jgi:hypothetical protein
VPKSYSITSNFFHSFEFFNTAPPSPSLRAGAETNSNLGEEHGTESTPMNLDKRRCHAMASGQTRLHPRRLPVPSPVSGRPPMLRLFRGSRGRQMLQEQNMGRDDDGSASPQPSRQTCCFRFSPKKQPPPQQRRTMPPRARRRWWRQACLTHRRCRWCRQDPLKHNLLVDYRQGLAHSSEIKSTKASGITESKTKTWSGFAMASNINLFFDQDGSRMDQSKKWMCMCILCWVIF